MSKRKSTTSKQRDKAAKLRARSSELNLFSDRLHNSINKNCGIFGRCLGSDICFTMIIKTSFYCTQCKICASTDSAGWFVKLMSRELFEIGIESYAWLEYGGYNSIDDIRNGNVVLSQDYSYIILFGVMLGLNSLFIGVLWILYAINHRKFYGASFNYEIFMIDAIFDTFYAIFPMLLVIDLNDFSYDSISYAVGALHTDSVVTLLSSLLPMIFLVRKMYFAMRITMIKARESWIEQLKLKDAITRAGSRNSGILRQASINIRNSLNAIANKIQNINNNIIIASTQKQDPDINSIIVNDDINDNNNNNNNNDNYNKNTKMLTIGNERIAGSNNSLLSSSQTAINGSATKTQMIVAADTPTTPDTELSHDIEHFDFPSIATDKSQNQNPKQTSHASQSPPSTNGGSPMHTRHASTSANISSHSYNTISATANSLVKSKSDRANKRKKSKKSTQKIIDSKITDQRWKHFVDRKVYTARKSPRSSITKKSPKHSVNASSPAILGGNSKVKTSSSTATTSMNTTNEDTKDETDKSNITIEKHWYDIFLSGEEFITPQLPTLSMLKHFEFSNEMYTLAHATGVPSRSPSISVAKSGSSGHSRSNSTVPDQHNNANNSGSGYGTHLSPKNMNSMSMSDFDIDLEEQKFMQLQLLQLRKQQIRRRCLIVVISILCILHSILVFVYIGSHFSNAFSVCDDFTGSSDLNILNTNHELFAWEYCTYKVYPLIFNYNSEYLPCNCRHIKIDESEFDDIVNRIQSYNNDTSTTLQLQESKVVSDIFKHWYMLESIKLDAGSSNHIAVNFSSDMFDASHLRVLSMDQIIIGTFDDNIKRWRTIEYLEFVDCQNGDLPQQSMQTLKNLKYILFDTALYMNRIDWICSLTNVEYLTLIAVPIEIFGDCFYDGSMKGLTKFQATFTDAIGKEEGNTSFIQLFNLPNLIEFDVLGSTSLTYDDFPSGDVNNGYFWYNNDTRYYLHATPLCGAYFNDEIYHVVKNYSQYLVDFLDVTECCKPYCDTVVEAEFLSCAPTSFNNGGM